MLAKARHPPGGGGGRQDPARIGHPAKTAMELLAALTHDRHLAAPVRVLVGTSEIDALATLLQGMDL